MNRLVFVVIATVMVVSCTVPFWGGSELKRISIAAYNRAGYPLAATVYLDGERKGLTPWKGEVSRKPHKVELKHWLYPVWSGELDSAERALSAIIEPSPEDLAQPCNSGNAYACFALAEILMNTKEAGKPAADFADRYYKQASRAAAEKCKTGDKPACALMGLMYLDEKGRMRDFSQAHSLGSDACKAGIALGCYVAGRAEFELADRDPASTPTTAKELLSASCDAGIPDACAYLGELLLPSQPNPELLTQAFTAFEQACKMGSAYGCSRLGEMYYKGSHAEENPYLAAPLLQKGCNLGCGLGCYFLARLKASGYDTNEPLSVQQLLERACLLGYTQACGGE